VRLHIATSCAELERLRSPWESLFTTSGGATLFQKFEWNFLAARMFGEREAPYVVFAQSGSGAALIPACVRKATNTLSLMGEELFDYRDYLAVGDQAPLLAAWEKLADLSLPFELLALRGREACQRWHWLEPQFFCGAPLAEPGVAPTAQRDMYELRRLLRRGASISQHSPSNRALLHWLYEQKGEQRWPNLFADLQRRAFMEAAAGAEWSHCEIFTLDLDGNVLAALVTFRDGNIRRFYTTYFDYRWAKHSPGFALLCEVAERTLAAGMAYDLMTGEQWFKTRLAPDAVPLYRIPPRQIGAALAAERLLAA
jgi:CelD/BcsL family acetyltransferase involved in cellulose biosynthesis